MNCIFSFLILSIIVCLSSPNTQTVQKPDLYISFEQNADHGSYKRHFREKSLKKSQNFYLYDFFRKASSKEHYQFSTKENAKPLIVDSSFIKRIDLKTSQWLKNLKDPIWPTWSKKFPYKHLYLVEKLNGNKYQITEVETFIGEDF